MRKNMRILIDTNILLDLIQVREPYSDNASKIINSCVKKENIGFILAYSLSDLFFILRKDKTVDERKAIILNLCKYFTIFSEDKNFYISVCQNPDWNDLEDGLQMKCADSENLDYIITRDKENGFKNSPVKIISPADFLKIHQ